MRRRIAPGALRAANVTYSDWIPLCHTKKYERKVRVTRHPPGDGDVMQIIVMKKVLTLILSVCMLFSVLAVAVLADDVPTFEPDTFYAAKGTPKIDGEMDDAYLKAPVIKIESGVPRESQRKTREEVSLRILWDENNLYLYFDIKDPYITPVEHEKQWTQDYTAMYQFYLGDSIGVYLNTSGQQHTDYRSEPGVVGCAMYNGAVNHGLAGNTLYAAAGHAPIWSGKTIADDDPNKAEKEAEVAAAKEVVNNCIYQTTIVTDAEGKATGWTCEMQIRFENFTATKDAVIGFVGQIDCDDQAKEKGGEGSGNWGTREYSLFTNSRANEQMQKECYKNTYFFDKLVLAEEPDLTPEQPEQPGQPENPEQPGNPENPGQQTTEPPTSEEPSKPNTPASTTEKKTDAKTDAPKDDKKGGCSSSIAELAFLTPVLAGFALLKKKKKSDN